MALGPSYQAADVEVWLIDDTLSNGYNNPRRQLLEKTDAFTAKGGSITLAMKPNSVALVVVGKKEVRSGSDRIRKVGEVSGSQSPVHIS